MGVVLVLQHAGALTDGDLQPDVLSFSLTGFSQETTAATLADLVIDRLEHLIVEVHVGSCHADLPGPLTAPR